jgi:hypothetical protein
MSIKITKSSMLILSVLSAGSAYSALHQDSRSEALPPREFLSGENFFSPQHYLDYLALREHEINSFASEKGVSLDVSLPATLIVGNGRGKYRDGENIDMRSYERGAYFYLLMDCASGANALRGIESFTPDLICDVLNLKQFAIENGMAGEFDVVVFENLPIHSSFTSEAVAGALTCLKPGGHLVTSSFPTFETPGLCSYLQAAQNSDLVKLGDYSWFYTRSTSGRLTSTSSLCILKTENLDSGSKLTSDSSFEEVAAFLNGHKEAFIDCLGGPARSQIGDLEFKNASFASRFWPRRPVRGFSISGQQLKPVMIITKK